MEGQLTAIVMLMCNRLAFITMTDMAEVKKIVKKGQIY